MNKTIDKPEKPVEVAASAPAPEPPRLSKREARAARLRHQEEAENAEVEALIPGGSGIPYTDLAAASGMDGDDLQVILDELEAAGKVSRAIGNNALSYVHL